MRETAELCRVAETVAGFLVQWAPCEARWRSQLDVGPCWCVGAAVVAAAAALVTAECASLGGQKTAAGPWPRRAPCEHCERRRAAERHSVIPLLWSGLRPARTLGYGGKPGACGEVYRADTQPH